MFSFNNPYGACTECSGLGVLLKFHAPFIVPDEALSIDDGAVRAWGTHWTQEQARFLQSAFDIDTSRPWQNMPGWQKDLVLSGTGAVSTKKFKTAFEGVIPNLERRYHETASEDMRHSCSIRPVHHAMVNVLNRSVFLCLLPERP
jgi:excinuclease ABC subunit A